MKNAKLQLKIKKEILLKNYASFKIGGSAKYFFEAKNKDDIIQAIKWAKEKSLPFFILGDGSNVLVSDKGFNGLVIKLQITSYKLQENKIIAEAGVKLNDLVKLSDKYSLTGLEWAAGIPGTLGGAIYGNAAAFGKKIGGVVEQVEVLEVEPPHTAEVRPLRIKILNKKQCQFSEKNSVFKKNKNLIVLSAVLKLRKGDREKIKNKIKENLSYREARHPKEPSAGCAFVNYQLPITNYQLLKKFPEFKQFKNQNFIPASFLIEKAGLKGKKIGNAKISEKHANFIVNAGGAKADDILKLADFAQKKVQEKFGIKLVLEIQKI